MGNVNSVEAHFERIANTCAAMMATGWGWTWEINKDESIDILTAEGWIGVQSFREFVVGAENQKRARIWARENPEAYRTALATLHTAASS